MARPRDEAQIGAAESCIDELKKVIREATAKADAIEAAVYDLKPVNPNFKANTETRTPAELQDITQAKGVRSTPRVSHSGR